jgi:hypothetical protein
MGLGIYRMNMPLAKLEEVHRSKQWLMVGFLDELSILRMVVP